MQIESGLLLGGRYRLLTRIAVGGMGEVWRAENETNGQIIAAKVLRTELIGQQQFLARLKVEARNTLQLRHPNLATVYDYGEQEGSGWIIMELVEGRPLSDILAGGQTMPLDLLLPVLTQTARALHVAHSAGVIHRDVKPANILITPENRVKLTDFGISLAPDQATLTQAGMVMGTAQYLPPEQALGKAAIPAGDIYALGIIAYEALAGKRPFTGSTQVDIAFAHVNETLPELPDSVPRPLVRLVNQMLAKDPAARPASAAVLADKLIELETRLVLLPRMRAKNAGVVPVATAAPAPAPSPAPVNPPSKETLPPAINAVPPRQVRDPGSPAAAVGQQMNPTPVKSPVPQIAPLPTRRSMRESQAVESNLGTAAIPVITGAIKIGANTAKSQLGQARMGVTASIISLGARLVGIFSSKENKQNSQMLDERTLFGVGMVVIVVAGLAFTVALVLAVTGVVKLVTTSALIIFVTPKRRVNISG